MTEIFDLSKIDSENNKFNENSTESEQNLKNQNQNSGNSLLSIVSILFYFNKWVFIILFLFTNIYTQKRLFLDTNVISVPIPNDCLNTMQEIQKSNSNELLNVENISTNSPELYTTFVENSTIVEKMPKKIIFVEKENSFSTKISEEPSFIDIKSFQQTPNQTKKDVERKLLPNKEFQRQMRFVDSTSNYQTPRYFGVIGKRLYIFVMIFIYNTNISK